MQTTDLSTVVVVGGGVAGLSAATFTARHGLDTFVIDSDDSIIRRTVHLENVPDFAAGRSTTTGPLQRTTSPTVAVNPARL